MHKPWRWLLAAMLFCGSPAGAAIAFVRGTENSTVSTTSFQVSITTTAGDDLVVGVFHSGGTLAVQTVTDSAGDVFTFQAGINIASPSGRVEIWTAHNIASSTFVKATWASATGGTTSIDVGEYSGVAAIGTNNTATAAGTSASVSLTTQDANNWIVSAFGDPGGATTATATAGTIRESSPFGLNATDWLMDNTVASPGSVTTSATPDAGPWGAAAVELRTTTGGGGGSPVIDVTIRGATRLRVRPNGRAQ